MAYFQSVEEVLEHYGVKGMQWGVRKAHPGYSSAQQQADRQKFGKRGVKKINTLMKFGHPHDQARELHRQNRNARRAVLVGAGAIIAARVLLMHGPAIAGHLADSAVRRRGAAAAANALADTRGLPAHQFIDLTFNSATNTWG